MNYMEGSSNISMSPEQGNFGDMLSRSWLGAASLAIGILTLLVFCLLVVAAVAIVGVNIEELTYYGQTASDDIFTALGVVGLCMCGTILLGLVGLGMGIGGLFQQEAAKGFAIAGIVINTLYLCMFLGLAVFSALSG